jgi:small subunit ribosomal protein S24e
MSTRPGLHRTVALANMYNSFDDLKKIEREFVVARITGERPAKIPRRQKKDARIKRYKRFGTLKRNMKKASRKTQND